MVGYLCIAVSILLFERDRRKGGSLRGKDFRFILLVFSVPKPFLRVPLQGFFFGDQWSLERVKSWHFRFLVAQVAAPFLVQQFPVLVRLVVGAELDVE